MAVLTVTETAAGPSRLNDDESGPSAGNGAASPVQKVLNHRPAWKELVDGHLLNTTYCNVHIHGIDGHVPCHHIFLKNMSSMLDDLIQDRVTSGSAPTPTNVLSIHLQETKVEHIQVVLSVLNSGQAVIDLKDEEEVRQVLRMLNIEKIVFEKQLVDGGAYAKVVRRENVIKTRGGGGEGDSEEELGNDDDIDDEVDVEDLEESLCGICALSFNSEMQLEAHLKEGCARARGFGKYFHLQKRFCKGCATNFENYDAATFIKHVDACVKSNYRGSQGGGEEDVDMEQDNLESDSNSVDVCPLRLFNVELDQLSSQVVKQIQQVVQQGKHVRLTRLQRRHYVFEEGESSKIASNEPKPNGCQRKEGEGKRRKLGPKSRRQRDLSQSGKSMPIPTAEIPTPPVTAVTEKAQPTAMDISPPVPEVNAVAQPTAMNISPPVPAVYKVAQSTFSDISATDEEIQSSSNKQADGRRKKPGSKSIRGERSPITAKATETPPVVAILPPPPAAEASPSPPAAVNTTPASIVQEIQRPTVIQEAPLSNLEMETAAGKEATIISQTQLQTEEKRTKSGPKRKTCPPPTLPHLHAIPTTASPLPVNMTITATTQPLSETITPPPPPQATIPLLVASTIPPALAVTLPSFASVPIPPHLVTSVSPSPPLSSTIAQIFSPMEIQPLDVQPNDIEIATPTTSKIVVRSQAAQTLGSLISSSTSTFSREPEFSSSATDLYCSEMIEGDLARNMIPTGRNENNSSVINEALARISDTVIFEPISPPEMLVVDVSPDSLAYGCPCANYPCACDLRWPIPSSSSTTFSRVNSATLGRNVQGVPPASTATGASPFQFIPTMTYSPRVSNNRTPPTNTTTHTTTTTVGPVMFPHLPTPVHQRFFRPSRPGSSVSMSGRGTFPFLPFARRSPTSQRSFRSVPPPRLIPAPIARRASSIDMRQPRPRTTSPSFGFLPQQLGNGIVVSRVTVPQPPPPSRSLATNQGNNNVINPSLIRDPRLEQNRVVLPPTAAAFRASTPTQARTLRPRQAGIRTLRNEHPPTFRFEPRIFRPQAQQQVGSPRTPPPTLRLPVFRPRIEVGQIYNRANGRLLQSPRQTPPPPSQAGIMERIARTHAQSPPQLRRAIPEPIITTAPTPNFPVQMDSSDPWDIINVTPPPQNQQQQQRPQDLQIPSPSPLLQYQSPSSPPDIMSIVGSPGEPLHLLSPLGFRNETFSMNLETGTRYEEPVEERRIPRVIYTCPDCRLSFETREGYQSHHEDGLC